jgi:hypothetical protein
MTNTHHLQAFHCHNPSKVKVKQNKKIANKRKQVSLPATPYQLQTHTMTCRQPPANTWPVPAEGRGNDAVTVT